MYVNGLGCVCSIPVFSTGWISRFFIENRILDLSTKSLTPTPTFSSFGRAVPVPRCGLRPAGEGEQVLISAWQKTCRSRSFVMRCRPVCPHWHYAPLLIGWANEWRSLGLCVVAALSAQLLPQVAHAVGVDGGQRREVGDGDVFVDLVQGGAVDAEFDGRRAVFGEEARVRGAAAGVEL